MDQMTQIKVSQGHQALQDNHSAAGKQVKKEKKAQEGKESSSHIKALEEKLAQGAYAMQNN
jgi:hypothetical protein